MARIKQKKWRRALQFKQELEDIDIVLAYMDKRKVVLRNKAIIPERVAERVVYQFISRMINVK